MSHLIQELIERAKLTPQTIAFPESSNADILKCAEQTVLQHIAYPLLIGNPQAIQELAAQNGVSTDGFIYYDNTDEGIRAELAQAYTQQFEDMTDKSVMRKAKDPVHCAMMLLKLGRADGVAAGKDYSTGDVLISAQAIVGLQAGIESISSIGIADIPDFAGPQGPYLGLADCAINPQPDAKELAGIAIASADTVRMLLNWEPRVAMLAFSTCGSAEHETIDTIRQAISLVQANRPDILIDGEFQLDTAILPKVAAKKVNRESAVAGQANVLIFPNLHAGNIGVKMVQIFGKANAYGPVLQGFAKPVCDFSRGAPVQEMLGNVAMLVIRAASAKSV